MGLTLMCYSNVERNRLREQAQQRRFQDAQNFAQKDAPIPAPLFGPPVKVSVQVNDKMSKTNLVPGSGKFVEIKYIVKNDLSALSIFSNYKIFKLDELTSKHSRSICLAI